MQPPFSGNRCAAGMNRRHRHSGRGRRWSGGTIYKMRLIFIADSFLYTSTSLYIVNLTRSWFWRQCRMSRRPGQKGRGRSASIFTMHFLLVSRAFVASEIYQSIIKTIFFRTDFKKALRIYTRGIAEEPPRGLHIYKNIFGRFSMVKCVQKGRDRRAKKISMLLVHMMRGLCPLSKISAHSHVSSANRISPIYDALANIPPV